MTRDLVFDHDGKPYAKAYRTPEQQAEMDAKDVTYWAWVEAKMQGRFTGTLAEFRETKDLLTIDATKELSAQTVKELRVLASEAKIRGRWKMRKAALIAAIIASAQPSEAGPLLKAMMEPSAAPGLGEPSIFCRWFALCDRPADRVRSHPIMGDVPICKRCDEKCEELS